MIETFRILLLSAHLLCVNVAAGAPLVCLWLEWRKSSASRDASRYLIGAAFVGLLLGGLLGMTIGWIAWDVEYAELWTVYLGRKVYWAIAEVFFSALILGGVWIWRGRPGTSNGLLVVRSVLLAASALNLLYHFPPLFFIGQRLPEMNVEGPVTAAEFRRLMFQGEIPALMVHFLLASIAVAGTMLMGLALRWTRQGRPADEVSAVARMGARWALIPTVLQLPVGLWVLATLPRGMQNVLLGQSPLGIIAFGLGLAAAVWLARELVSIALGETERSGLIRAMAAMVVTVTLMTAAHEIARGGPPTKGFRAVISAVPGPSPLLSPSELAAR